MSKKIIVAVMVIVFLAGVALYRYFDKIALVTLSRFYGLDISYKGFNKDPQGAFVFEDMRVINKNMGMGFFSQRAAFKLVWKANFLKTLNFNFKFKDVHFIKKGEEKYRAKYETLSEMVAMPFEGRWMYKEVSGEAEVFLNGLTLKNFNAGGRHIRLILSGDIFYNNIIDTDITIYFSKDVLKDIPPEVHSIIMRDEPDEWKSFSVKLKGDLSSPSIQVSGKLFRLNIGTVVMK